MSLREDLDAPAIAKDYWRLDSNAKLIDVIYAVRSDESTHRYNLLDISRTFQLTL